YSLAEHDGRSEPGHLNKCLVLHRSSTTPRLGKSALAPRLAGECLEQSLPKAVNFGDVECFSFLGDGSRLLGFSRSRAQDPLTTQSTPTGCCIAMGPRCRWPLWVRVGRHGRIPRPSSASGDSPISDAAAAPAWMIGLCQFPI